MKARIRMAIVWAALLVLLPMPSSWSAEIVRLTEDNWLEYAPLGKEVDAIYGDYVLGNDRIAAVIANPIEGRNANMSVKRVGGFLIDLTERNKPSDQLIVLSGPLSQYPMQWAHIQNEKGRKVTLLCSTLEAKDHPLIQVRYSLEDGQQWLHVETVLSNTTSKSLSVELTDAVRAERTFASGKDDDGSLAWIYDKWFGQAYGIVPDGRAKTVSLKFGNKVSRFEYTMDGQNKVTLAPGEKVTLKRRVLCAANALQIRAIANRLKNVDQHRVTLSVADPKGGVAGADVEVKVGDELYANGRSDQNGVIEFSLPPGSYTLAAASLGRGSASIRIELGADLQTKIALPEAGQVKARITDNTGGPIPCKVQFIGVDGTKDPYFFPDTGEHGVHNVYYSHNGRFRQALEPGRYETIISYGPEYDAVFKQIQIERGVETSLNARLIRSVDTTGWISSDFHSHSSPSGDNSSSQLGRVLNLLCEHIEFAPCTEHNRLDTYGPHLRALGVEHLMATAIGIELTGSPGRLNHQNAFPFIRKEHTQDNGAPLTDKDPFVQIERLALWDNKSEKLVQENHPNIVQLLFDKNLDGKADEAHHKMLSYMDVIEVHPPQKILQGASVNKEGINDGKNRMHSWLQMINQGHRIPGVVNTDAHYNFHGSGGLRNYIKSPTDDPAAIKTLDIVRESKRGHIIVTNGPFLEVSLTPTPSDSSLVTHPGDEIKLAEGSALLHIRVQCPNWFDIDRVQVLLNGRAEVNLNFTRKNSPGKFSDTVIKFDQKLPLSLKRDTHVIVVVIGEESSLGPVMGPDHQKNNPVAVSNPIYVDVDGNGFQPNGDTLGAPLPILPTSG